VGRERKGKRVKENRRKKRKKDKEEKKLQRKKKKMGSTKTKPLFPPLIDTKN